MAIDTIFIKNQNGGEDSYPIGAGAENVIYNENLTGAAPANSVHNKIKITDAHIATKAVTSNDGVHGLRYQNGVLEAQNGNGTQVPAAGTGDMTKAVYDPNNDGIIGIAQGGTGNSDGYIRTGTTQTAGSKATAEGQYTVVTGDYSHAEGNATSAIGKAAHAEGGYSTSIAANKHGTIAVGNNSHAEGLKTYAVGLQAHAEGEGTTAYGEDSHAEGYNTYAGGLQAHVEGFYTTAYGNDSHAEGYYTYAIGDHSHAEGTETCATKLGSHAEGQGTISSATASHVEGTACKAIQDGAHAEGAMSTASGFYSHAEGMNTQAIGNQAHTEGNNTIANAPSAHAEGIGTTASNTASHAGGHYNAVMTTGGSSDNQTGTAFVIGNGVSSSALSNAFSVQYDGTVRAKSSITGNTTADYAEFFEQSDNNTEEEDRVGYFVTFDDGKKIKIASAEDDYILGIISGAPFVVGNGDCDTWTKMELRDEFNRVRLEPAPLYKRNEETGEDEQVLDDKGNPVYQGTRPIYNPEYDSSQPYIPRDKRPEWAAVGMLGVLPVRDDGTCEVNGYCTVAEGGIATKATSESVNKYRVIKRKTENVIEVVFR